MIMKVRNVFFAFSFIVVLSLFGLLYFLGIMNLFMKESMFFDKFRWLDFGKPVISIFYLSVLTIFFIVIFAIMVRIIISLKHDSDRKKIDDVHIDAKFKKQGKLVNEAREDEIENDTEFYKKMEQMINVQDRIAEEATFVDKVVDLYENLDEIVGKILKSDNIADLFENILSTGMTFTNSEKGSIMVVDKNKEIYIYKILGRRNLDKYKDVKIKLGHNISGKVALENRLIFMENIDIRNQFEFKYKSEYKTRSFISIPIFGLNRVVAVLNLTDNKKGFYDKSDIKLVEIIAKISSKVFELIQTRKKLKYNI
jgi:hypothetical protein